MKAHYFKEYSNILGKDLEFKSYGFAGKPIIMFPTSDSRFYQYEDFGLIDTIKNYIKHGQVQVFTADGMDFDTITKDYHCPDHRIKLHEQYVRYICEELTPRIMSINGGDSLPITFGCSMGGYHATNFFFRRPDLFGGVISLSGLFTIRDFFKGYDSDLLRANCALDYLTDLTMQDTKYAQYLKSRIVICCGQGNHEEVMLNNIARLREIFAEKKIPAMIDVWGYDVHHDWPWWKKQLPYFLEKILKN